MAKQLVALLLLGVMVGSLLGVGFTVWRKHAYPIPGYGTLLPRPVPGLQVSCSGGVNPVVLVSWTTQLDQFQPGLQKSVAGDAFRTFGAPKPEAGRPYAVDVDVQPNTVYRYRIMNGGTLASAVVEIETGAASCTGQ